MKKSGIYRIQSACKPERIYIGSAIDIPNRWRHHKSDLRLSKHINRILQNHCNKYGINDLRFEVICECKKEDLLITEQTYLDLLMPHFNINPKAESRLGAKCSDEIKKKFSEARQGMRIHLGHKHSEEAKRKMSEKKMGNQNGAGYTHTDEARRKMRETKRTRRAA